MTLNENALREIRRVLGENGVLAGDAVGPRYRSDARGVGEVIPALVLRPQSTDEVSRVMAICCAENQRVVVQGGMTGLVVGARPQAGEVVLSFERMARVETIDPEAGTMLVQAGTPLQVVQDSASAHDRFYPLDLGARGSCTIGGNLATNAGGNRVLRYGMTRSLTLGLEVVLADGTVLSNLTGYLKNNTGYDLKHLFIGSEGTLGLITRARLRVFPKPRTQIVGFCAIDSFAAVVETMSHLQQSLGADLSAFEVIWRDTYTAVISDVVGVTQPLPTGSAFYVLTELLGSNMRHDRDKFEAALQDAMRRGLISDAVVSQSDRDVNNLWAVRDGMAEAMSRQQPAISFDISLDIPEMANLESTLRQRLADALSEVRVFIGGHLADGNLHLVAKQDSADPQPRELIERMVYGLVGEIGGSISAEHGIGTLKRDHLPQSRTPAELAVMRSLKDMLDPKALLGRGRILAPRARSENTIPLPRNPDSEF